MNTQTELSRAGHVCAVSAARILSAYLESFESPIRVPEAGSIADMRRDLTKHFDLIRKLRPEIPRVAKGKNTVEGLTEYAARVWGELVDLESCNRRLDFSVGVLWLIPDLPTLDMVVKQDWPWAKAGTEYPRKLTGAFIYQDASKEPAVINASNVDSRRIDYRAVPKSSAPCGCSDEHGPCKEHWAWTEAGKLGDKLQTLGLIKPDEWTTSGTGELEMIGIKKAGLARIVDALELRTRVESTELPAEEGFWIAEHQGEFVPVEVATSFDWRPPAGTDPDHDPGELVVLLPGVGTERPLDHVRLLWPIKVWTEAEVLVAAGQLLADHGLRPASFKDFVADLVKMIGGVRG